MSHLEDITIFSKFKSIVTANTKPGLPVFTQISNKHFRLQAPCLQ